ncbi:TPA: hypothetical protein QEM49_001370 [Pseudomonas putida]|uniref:hypothetical protein n=1 Tax=Pseudomonas putida TaxID=303 RepID=UPI002363F742|nr:hypothetical protein [Pseudomonas putida]MDD2010301.1 hypothetical protein [Pseudomonas putida]HDS1776887.1 hypothetical protein [Pseudomonas putida]
MHYYRSPAAIDWEEFLEVKSNNYEFLLDFEIDAGFSFATAVAHEKTRENQGSVALDESLDIPELQLSFDCSLKNTSIHLNSITIQNLFRLTYEATDKYRISTKFTLKKIDFDKLEQDLQSSEKDKPELSRTTLASVCMVEYFQAKADIIKEVIISYIELSGYFAKLIPATLSLYAQSEQGIFRILQQSGGHESAGHYPVHPKHITKELVTQNFQRFSLMPTNIKKHFQKGLHYKFLGFYDESYLCFYKLIETTFKTDKFQSKALPDIFGIDSKQLRETLNKSNQRIMMLFIYQAMIKNNSDVPDEEKAMIMAKMLEASTIRNDIAHSSDQTKNSKSMLQFIMNLSNMMLAYIE